MSERDPQLYLTEILESGEALRSSAEGYVLPFIQRLQWRIILKRWPADISIKWGKVLQNVF